MDVQTPQEINQNINPTITYNKVIICLYLPYLECFMFIYFKIKFTKGSGIVRMLSYILGDDTFTRGLSVTFYTKIHICSYEVLITTVIIKAIF